MHATWNVSMSVHITFHAHSDHMINTTYIKGEGYTVGYMACHDITFHACIVSTYYI